MQEFDDISNVEYSCLYSLRGFPWKENDLVCQSVYCIVSLICWQNRQGIFISIKHSSQFNRTLRYVFSCGLVFDNLVLMPTVLVKKYLKRNWDFISNHYAMCRCVNRTESKGFTPEAWKEGGQCYCACCEFVSKQWNTPLPSWWDSKQQKSTLKKSSAIKHCGDVTVTRKING